MAYHDYVKQSKPYEIKVQLGGKSEHQLTRQPAASSLLPAEYKINFDADSQKLVARSYVS